MVDIMNQTSVQPLQDLNWDLCWELHQLLGEAGILCAFYRVDHDQLTPVAPVQSDENTCGLWNACQTEIINTWKNGSGDSFGSPSPCSHNHLRLMVPIYQRRHLDGIMVCCLKSFQYEKTESLERLCSQLQIDTDWLVSNGLSDAVAQDQFLKFLNVVIPHLIETTKQNIDQQHDIEAMTNSLSQSYEEISLLHRINDGMKLTRNPSQFFAELCEDIRSVVDAEKIMMMWSENPLIMTDPQMVESAGGLQLEQSHFDILWQKTQFEAETSSGILIDNNVDHPYTHQWPAMIRNIVSVPVKRDQNNMGALIALNKNNKADFDSIDTKLLISVANELAVYLDNFRLYGDLQDLLIGSLRALTSSIDAKDPYTCGHSERVAVISHWLARKLNLSQDQQNDIYLAGLLHDVGKIGVSELVLRKPGRLTQQEFNQIHQHPQIGANILAGIKQITDVTRAVLTHHERYDGKGYPMGLKGHEIPLAGRIVKIADSFDAMTSDRVYRKALPVIAALAEIRNFSGTQFDPKLTEIFLKADINDLIEQMEQTRKNPVTSVAPPADVFS